MDIGNFLVRCFAVAILGVCLLGAALASSATVARAADEHVATGSPHAPAGVHAAHDPSEHIGHGNATPDLENPVEPKADMAIATLLVFVGLLAVLWIFAWGPISEGLEKREAGIAASIRGAEDANIAAQKVLKEQEARLAATAEQVRVMLDGARRDAEQAKRQIEAEAKMSAEAERTRALREIDVATNQALKSLAEKSADLAVDLAGKIVGAKLSPAEHAQLIEEAIGRFPGAHAPNGQPSHN